MSNETISMSRELAELCFRSLNGGSEQLTGMEHGRAFRELRALLAQPAEKFNPQGWSIDHSAGRPILMHNNCSVIEAEQAYGLLELINSTQYQGEPVAWRGMNEYGEEVTDWIDGVPPERMTDLCGNPDNFASIQIAYARPDEQPAPVAVVLPEQWQPIETCPKHVDVLFYHERNGVIPGRLTNADSLMTDKERDDWDGDEDARFIIDAFGFGHWGVDRMDGSEAPTHWQPLPTPPQQ